MYYNFQSLVLRKTNSIRDAIQNLNETGKQIILICDDEDSLIGTVSDGDIRKALVVKHSLEQKLCEVMNATPIFSRIEDSIECVRSLMLTKGLRAIPVVASNAKLVGIHFLEEIAYASENKAVMLIMAGGFGSRMGKLTENIPKPMLKVAGKPMLQHIVEKAVDEKFEKIFISVHHLAEKIQKYFKDGEKFGVQIEYLEEENPLGTGGSVQLIKDVNGPILVTNADILSNINYKALIDFHQYNRAGATIATREHIIQHQFGVVENAGIDFVSFQEKPEWVTTINAGIYVINSETVNLIASKEVISMPEIIERVKGRGKRVVVYPLYENWVDLGSPEQYASYC